MRRRILWLVTLWHAAVVLLVWRVGEATLFPDSLHSHRGVDRWQSHIRTATELEHMKLVQTDDGRGRILYRNGQPWSGVSKVESISSGSQVRSIKVHSEKTPWPAEAVLGQVGLPDEWPAADKTVAEQGRSGLEARFDSILQAKRPGYIGRLQEAGWHEQGNNISSSGLPWFTMSSLQGAEIRTTVDPAWQSKSRQALQQAGVREGAVVLLDVHTRDVLAMTSVNVGDPWKNLAISAQTPGSVFKIVTAAAALETYRVRLDQPFYCPGFSTLPGVHMLCWRKHGQETFAEAFAQSCDVVFSEVANAVGGRVLDMVAKRMGITSDGLQQVSGQPVLGGSRPGVVSRGSLEDLGRLANTAIGQQDVRISPLQAANLAAVVADNGWYRDTRLIQDFEQGGTVRRVFQPAPAARALEPVTAMKMQEMMRQTVTLPGGTAHALVDAPVPVAAKTGTAELPGRQHVNAWMVGYFPANSPKIAFAVLVKNAPSPTAHAAVQQIVQRFAAMYRQFHGRPVIR